MDWVSLRSYLVVLEENPLKGKERSKDHPKTFKKMNHTLAKIHSRYITWTQTFGRHEVTKTSFKCFAMKNDVFTPAKSFFPDKWMNHHHQRVWTKFSTCFITDNVYRIPQKSNEPSPVPHHHQLQNRRAHSIFRESCWLPRSGRENVGDFLLTNQSVYLGHGTSNPKIAAFPNQITQKRSQASIVGSSCHVERSQTNQRKSRCVTLKEPT